MIEIAKGNYISRIWFFYAPEGKGELDVLAHLWRRLPEGLWTLEYRFRYYEDGKAHDSKDRKSLYVGTFAGPANEEQIWEKIEVALQAMRSFLPPGFAMDVTDGRTDEPVEVVRLLLTKPYMHARIEEWSS